MDYKDKYLKYKNKYNNLKSLLGGNNCLRFGFQQHSGECWHDSLGMLLMQSDLTKDDFIRSMQSINIDEVQAKLVDLFSPKNLDKNAYLLPYTIYIYYLKNKTSSDIHKKITDFLEYCKIYVTNHILRALNRITDDENMSRYPKDQYKYSVFGDMQQIQEDIAKTTIPTEKQRLRRQGSVQATIMCTETLFTIYDLFTRTGDKFISVTDTDKRAGDSIIQILAIEILNMYILRNIPKHETMYFNFYINNSDIPIRPDGEANPIIKEYNLSSKIKSDVPQYIINNIHQECYLLQLNALKTGSFLGVIICGYKNDNVKKGHSISLYKCDGTSFIYDNDDKQGVLTCKWELDLETFLREKINKREHYLLYSNSQYKLDKYGLKLLSVEENADVEDNEPLTYYLFMDKKIFIQKNNFREDQEIYYIFDKCNYFTDVSELKILYTRLFQLIDINVDNYDRKKKEFFHFIKIYPILNMYNFMKYAIDIFVTTTVRDERKTNKLELERLISKYNVEFYDLLSQHELIRWPYESVHGKIGNLWINMVYGY